MVDFVLERIVKVYRTIDDGRHFVRILARIQCHEQRTVIDEFADEIFDVFFDVSEIHTVKLFCVNKLKASDRTDGRLAGIQTAKIEKTSGIHRQIQINLQNWKSFIYLCGDFRRK